VVRQRCWQRYALRAHSGTRGFEVSLASRRGPRNSDTPTVGSRWTIQAGGRQIRNPKSEIRNSDLVLSYHLSMTVEVRIRRLPHAEGLPLPDYATAGAAGADVCAAVDRDLVIEPGKRVAVPTGLVMEIPTGFEVQVRPRSGLAIRHGLTVVNAPGTIDSDYRGELKVLMVNLGSESATIGRGDRIAQLVVAPVTRAVFVKSSELASSERGGGGFGSTGV
jgi:dUTP pyrophosphatase